MQEGTNTTNLLKSSRFFSHRCERAEISNCSGLTRSSQTFREDRLASHFFSDVFPLKEFITMRLMYLLEVPSLEEIRNLGIHQIPAVLEQIPFPCYVGSDCMR